MVTLLTSNPLGLAKMTLHLRTAMQSSSSGRVHGRQPSGMEGMPSFTEHCFGERFVKVTDLEQNTASLGQRWMSRSMLLSQSRIGPSPVPVRASGRTGFPDGWFYLLESPHSWSQLLTFK